jgi:polyhydroxybutyrate depolymerase
MGKILGSILMGMLLAAGVACSDASSPATTTNGASGATGSPTGSGGSNNPTSGGPTTSGSAGQPTSGSGGQSGSGSSTGGSGGATGGSGGTSTTDASAPETSGPRDGSTASDAPVVIGDSGRPPKPSTGCGNMTPPATGSRMIVTGGQMGMYNINVPANYNPTTPMGLGFGFHGSGNGACGPTTGECRGFAQLNAVTVYMKSFGVGWEGSTLEQNVTFFNDVMAFMKSQFCIDENRIFIAGVSSGGQFTDVLSCRYGDTLWQVTPVSAAALNPGNCKGTPPALIIHGVTDAVGNYGQGTAQMFATRNGCSATAPAGLAKAKMDMQAAFDANPKRTEHVCLDWDTCPANSPVRFCISSQVTYSGLTHGWPMIGGMLVGDFQTTLK